MKTHPALILLAFLLLALPDGAGAADEAGAGSEKVTLKWLGVVGWDIRVGKTTILIDPFLTRRRAEREHEWQSDEAAVLEAIHGADYIFIGHSHADHAGDAPFIAKRFGAKVVGSRTTANLMRSAGVDDAKLTAIKGGEKFDFGDFSVEAVESLHGVPQGQYEVSETKELLSPVHRILGRHFVEGGSFLYVFTFGNRRLLHQSTANFIQDKLPGLSPDMALLAEPGRAYNLKDALRALKPKTVIMQHFDDWRVPFSQALPSSHTRRAERFKRDILAVDGAIKVIIPEFMKTYTLE
jgi:L-ascorbate metabolism protein UlaG (beta-lactamase superfamily)